MARQPADRAFSLGGPRVGTRRTGTIVTAMLLAAYVLAAYLVPGHQLPWPLQRLLGLGCVALALAVYALATRPAESPEELLYRLRRGQHSDFGKQLAAARARQRTVKLPGLGEVSVRTLGGVGVFLVVCLWWLTPWAPVIVEKRTVGDLFVPLGEEILAAPLVMPNGRFAITQPPVIWPAVRERAGLIRDGGDEYLLGLKALAEGRFDDARSRLAAASREQPADPVHVSLARAQNEMYATRFAEAAQHYAEVLKASPDDPLLLCQAAVAWIQAGKSDKAEPLLAQAEKLAAKRAAENPLAQGVCLHVRAVLCVGLGRELDRAENFCSQSRAILEKELRQPHPLVAASLNNQATIYLLRGNYPGAERLYEAAREQWSSALGPKHADTVTSLANLGVLDQHLGRYQAAMKRLAEAQAIRGEALGEQHAIVGLGWNAAALPQLSLYQSEEARYALDRALAIAEKQLGPNHPAAAAALDTLVTLHLEQAQYAKAEATCVRTLGLAERAWGAHHPFVACILNRAAAVNILQGNFQLAEERCVRARQIAQDAFDERSLAVAAVKRTQGRLELRRDRPEEARKLLGDALKTYQDAFGKEHPEIADILGDLASLNTSPDTLAEGVAEYRRAIEMAKKFFGGEHPEVARLLVGLAQLYIPQEKYADAQPLLAEALEIQKKALVPYHPDLAATLEAYATVLRKGSAADPGQAAAMEAQAKAVRKQHAERDLPE